MNKLLGAVFAIIIFTIFPQICVAESNSFVTVVNPVRGSDFWDLDNQKPQDLVIKQKEIIKNNNLPVTWLMRFDALSDPVLLNEIKNIPLNNEVGLFLEITPTLTKFAGVNYRQSKNWHSAGSVFLTGYEVNDRYKIIDAAFSEFKNKFGSFPKSVGAWYIDSNSLSYMQKKYQIESALIVADQYTTDNYQIWGQYWSYPYFPSATDTLIPAQKIENKIPVVIMQWAPRDPVNAYGNGVAESTYSLQANDYLDYHKLDIQYFSKLIDIFLKQPLNQVNQVVVGLENSYSFEKYGLEYQKQIEVLVKKQSQGELKIVTMKDFAALYSDKFKISPPQVISSKDPLGSSKEVVWFMNPYYRLGWFGGVGSIIRDLRQYVEGVEEPCFKNACNSLNFATFSTRVLDDITYQQKRVLDLGKIKDIKVSKKGENFIISYVNEAGVQRDLELLPRDISIGGQISSIDGFILQTVSEKPQKIVNSMEDSIREDIFRESWFNFGLNILKFLGFMFLGLFIPGYVLIKKANLKSIFSEIFIALPLGFTIITLTAFLGGVIKFYYLPLLIIVPSLAVFVLKKDYLDLLVIKNIIKVKYLPVMLMILLGVIFQTLSLIKSGWVYNFGIGFWGPLAHDGVWHQALVNQLLLNVPPQNPGFSGEILSNYHYFYDLLIAQTTFLTQVSVVDLIYRFYPIIFSLSLGFGSYLFARSYFKNKWAPLLSLFFVYFGSSFGWIVSILKKENIGGESTFWMNQPVSLNLNPPFAISLIILIAISIFIKRTKFNLNYYAIFSLLLLSGVLIEFKVYAGLLVIGGLLVSALVQILFQKKLQALFVFLGSSILSLALFLPSNSGASGLIQYSPFWFIHSMIDITDRVGWERLTLARENLPLKGDYLKYILVEIIGFLIYLLGNLGTRFFAVFPLIQFFKQKLWKLPEDSFVVSLALASFIIPIFFVQKGNSWNTIQFSYYFLYLSAIFAGGGLVYLFTKMNKIITIFILAVILIVTPISAFATFRSGFYPTSPARLTLGELEALTNLDKMPEGIVLTYPYDKKLRNLYGDPYPMPVYETTSYVSAYSGKPVFIEDEIQQEILYADSKNADIWSKRVIEAKEFFISNNNIWRTDFLEKNSIKYIYLPKLINTDFQNEGLNIKKIYNNEEADIYEVLN